MIKINLNNTKINNNFNKYQDKVNKIHEMINNKTGKGNEFLGWTSWPTEYFKSQEYNSIKKIVNKLYNLDIEVMVVIGIGGSYLGSKAGIDFVMGSFGGQKKVYYAGTNLSSFYISQLINKLKNKKWSICMISKSGTTLEPAISFRILREELIKKEGLKKANELTIAITDGKKGTLKNISDKNGLTSFVIPDDIGGRFSVITPVGLVPLLFAGIDIDKLMEGSILAQKELNESDIKKNEAYKYAVARIELSKKYQIELMGSYEPNIQYLLEWWKQLYGESEGKEGKGLFPASVNLTSDLHSLGQYIQEGKKNLLFETTIWFNNTSHDISIKEEKEEQDGLNYLANKKLGWINEQAYKGVLDAHVNEGKVENIIIEVDEINSFSLGYIFFFFMKSCAMSAYLMDVNPFNQPGVEAYKKSMFKLLGKK